MTEQGVRQDDPEYLKAINILKSVQQQTTFNRQRALAQQQTQQQPSHPVQANKAQDATNGVNGTSHRDYLLRRAF